MTTRKSQTCWPTPQSLPTRRKVLKASLLGLGGSLLTTAHAQTPAAPDETKASRVAFATDHQMQPLSFKPASLKGLSAGLIESHWSNNYGGSVRALNEVNKRLDAALSDASLPAFIYNDLKREHLLRTGSVALHELYFDNLGAGQEASADTRRQLGTAFGSFDRWEMEFRRIAAGLGGGAGWVMLGYNRHFQRLENYWMADHAHTPAATAPLLVLDMYEHSYHIDFGAAAARYVDAFFANINWDAVAARLDAVHI